MVEDDMQDIGRDQLERLNSATRRRLQTVQKLDSRRHVAHFGERGGACHRLRKQLHRRGGDHAKRSFGANKEVPQIITRIVLAKPAKQVQDAAAHQHHLDTKSQLARCSVTNDIQPAGIGPKIAADGAASLCRQIEREIEALLLGRVMKGLQDAPRLDSHRHIGGVDLADAVHPA